MAKPQIMYCTCRGGPEVFQESRHLATICASTSEPKTPTENPRIKTLRVAASTRNQI
jgi:hypothetical protein